MPHVDTPEQNRVEQKPPMPPVKQFTRDWYNRLPPINADLKNLVCLVFDSL